MQPIISIIIPVLNEEAIIAQTLKRLQASDDVELIVVDGGSQDRTVEIARQMNIRAIAAEPNRASQMNAGAAIAKGNFLLFLHADSQLPSNYAKLVRQSLAQTKVIAGAFELAIDAESKALRLVETMVKLRSRFLQLPYGDQAIFIRKQAFIDIGGYANLPIMEDFEFISRLKHRGKIAIAPAAVVTSARRWQKLGVFKTTLVNQLIIIGYFLRISPHKLRNFYHRIGNSKKRSL
ncbi:TIGR04283 family arsenosugar biosynthesis glycosyltransferase [Myxosarcina sp. GI1]|uniref:TIGR04283 family arsenosugar biosynthesis glycosyltransferase n=1 Tax=Myxosarcina sp. GI1 TaxID=1541065 RepID=UPI0005673998|nr:TIGR04283 family arsenosugar biosynthesis glycosyltransferase [Myxosarcina sp. GI1]